MVKFEHAVAVPELVIFKSPWDWLKINVGIRRETWEIDWNDSDSDIGKDPNINFDSITPA